MARLRRHQSLIAAAAALAFAGAVLFWWLLRGPAEDDVRRAVVAAESAFESVQVFGDVSFFLTQGAKLAGRDIRLALDDRIFANRGEGIYRYEYYFWMNRHRALPDVPVTRVRMERGSFDPGFLRDPRDPLAGPRLERAMRITTTAIDCAPGQAPLDTGLLPDYGYVATHQLLGLLIAAQRSCLERQAVHRYAPAYVTRIYSEMMAYYGELTDIQVERAAMLALVGRIDLVPDRLVKMLLASQRPDGFWYFGVDSAESQNVIGHNSALSYMVLAAWLGRQQYIH